MHKRLAAAVLLIATGALAQQPLPVVEKKIYPIPRAASAIHVDGDLSDAAWQSAVAIPVDYEWSPARNVPALVATTCLVTYDSDNFYIAFKASDPHPNEIRAHVTDRDVPFLDDTVGFMIDTFNDERRSYQFRINAAGVQMDAVNSDVDQSEDWSWDAIWSTAAVIGPDGYTVEVAIPFKSLRFTRTGGAQTWGIRAMRDYPRSVRHRFQSGPDRNMDCNACQWDKLSGLEGIEPGRNLELDPTLTARRTDEKQSLSGPMESGDTVVDPGLTARWGITPDVAISAAINPDFSQIEADAAQLAENTEFALYYPEKRPFFLEGADFFATPLEIVFTRTVADPSWGAKVWGKIGDSAFGGFVTRDQINNLIFPSNQGSAYASLNESVKGAVLRYRRDVGKSSNLGVLYTGREGDDYHNRVGGVDGTIRLTGVDNIRFQLLRSDTAYPKGISRQYGQPLGAFSDDALHVNYTHQSRDWFWRALYESLGRDFRADSGFIAQVDTKYYATFLQRNFWAKPGSWFTEINFELIYQRLNDRDGRLTVEQSNFVGRYSGPKQSTFAFNLVPWREYYRGVVYDNFRHTYAFSIRPSGSVGFDASLRAGDAIDYTNGQKGTLIALVPSLDLNLGRHLTATVDHTYQKLDVAAGRLFTANLLEMRAIYNFNVRTFVRAIVQFTDIDRDLAHYTVPVPAKTRAVFTQLLFSYKLNPQTVALFGYSDNYFGGENIDLTQKDRTVFAKLGYAWVW